MEAPSSQTNLFRKPTTKVGSQQSVLFHNRHALCEDMKFVTSAPELCDVVFLVGPDKEPVYGVKAILAVRSRVFDHMIQTHKSSAKKLSNKATNSPFPSFLRSKRRASCFGSSTLDKDNTPYGTHLKIPIEDFDLEAFSRLITYAHSGVVTINVHTVIGLLNAAETFDFQDLKKACKDYALDCTTSESKVTPLINSSKKYLHFKTTKVLMQKAITFVNQHPELTQQKRRSNSRSLPKGTSTPIRDFLECRPTIQDDFDNTSELSADSGFSDSRSISSRQSCRSLRFISV